MTDVEIIEAMVKFMKQSNEMFKQFAIEISNIKVDIEKLKKHQTPRIVIPGVNNYRVDAIGKDDGNGKH